MLADDFARMFRDEHRIVRDTLLDLVQAFEERDRERIHTLLAGVARFTGPHFRYEEESMYPALTGIFGEEYIQKLLRDHDRAIEVAEELVQLSSKAELTGQDVTAAIRLIRGSVMPHVSDCDGLSIMVETLPETQVQNILDSRRQSLAANLDLLTWAKTVRRRPALVAGSVAGANQL
ncbi:MAG: hemerythrin domain-containing protein [Acidimicrobiia bacterium]|nr:hemerythrin domain-containing protein [Acidimicrobiia bacterium]